MNIGQAIIPALKAIGKPGMVNTQKMKRRGVQVMNMHRVLDDVVAEIVCFSMDMATLDAGTRHPDAVATGVVLIKL